jgi:hypothetical protein
MTTPTNQPEPTWLELVAHVNGRTVFGQAGVRDPDHLCDAYDPTADADYLGGVTAPGTGSCESDGHYLCGGCHHLSADRRADLLEPDHAAHFLQDSVVETSSASRDARPAPLG